MRSRIFFSSLFIGLLLAGCSRPPELVGVDNPETPVASVPGASRHKIFLASTRQASETVGAFFSAERAPELGLASVIVSVPPTHVTGELVRPRRLPPDPRTEFAIIEPTIYNSDGTFIASINAELARRKRGERGILFFVHGYNNTTSDALLRLGQFVEDTEFEGVAVLYDWASAAKLSRYVYDMNSAMIARSSVTDIGNILARTNAEGYDVFAHSMGGFLMMEAVRDQAARGTFNSSGRLRNIILASPDIDDSSSGSHTKFAGSPDVVQLLGRGLNSAETFSRHARTTRLDEMLAGISIQIEVQ